MPDDMRRSFERWYREQTRRGKGSPVSSTASSPESGKENRFDGSMIFGPHFPPGSAGYPALRGELNATHFSRTRIRTSFDPDLEIPRLQRWFEQNQHPTRDQMIFYLNELNALESRRGRKPLDLTNIITGSRMLARPRDGLIAVPNRRTPPPTERPTTVSKSDCLLNPERTNRLGQRLLPPPKMCQFFPTEMQCTL